MSAVARACLRVVFFPLIVVGFALALALDTVVALDRLFDPARG